MIVFEATDELGLAENRYLGRAAVCLAILHNHVCIVVAVEERVERPLREHEVLVLFDYRIVINVLLLVDSHQTALEALIYFGEDEIFSQSTLVARRVHRNVHRAGAVLRRWNRVRRIPLSQVRGFSWVLKREAYASCERASQILTVKQARHDEAPVFVNVRRDQLNRPFQRRLDDIVLLV